MVPLVVLGSFQDLICEAAWGDAEKGLVCKAGEASCRQLKKETDGREGDCIPQTSLTALLCLWMVSCQRFSGALFVFEITAISFVALTDYRQPPHPTHTHRWTHSISRVGQLMCLLLPAHVSLSADRDILVDALPPQELSMLQRIGQVLCIWDVFRRLEMDHQRFVEIRTALQRTQAPFKALLLPSNTQQFSYQQQHNTYAAPHTQVRTKVAFMVSPVLWRVSVLFSVRVC